MGLNWLINTLELLLILCSVNSCYSRLINGTPSTYQLPYLETIPGFPHSGWRPGFPQTRASDHLVSENPGGYTRTCVFCESRNKKMKMMTYNNNRRCFNCPINGINSDRQTQFFGLLVWLLVFWLFDYKYIYIYIYNII